MIECLVHKNDIDLVPSTNEEEMTKNKEKLKNIVTPLIRTYTPNIFYRIYNKIVSFFSNSRTTIYTIEELIDNVIVFDKEKRLNAK